MIEAQDCRFCGEFERGFIVDGQDYGSRILWSSENYVVFPALGPLMEGNLLIAPKAHFVGITAVPEELYGELEEIKERTRRAVEEEYQTPFFFEHGEVAERKRGGCCIDHAHLQVIPSEVDNRVGEALEKRFSMRRIREYKELKANREQGIPYIFLETRDRNRYVFDVPDVVPSQYVRQVIAVQMSQPQRWDWRREYRIDEMLTAVERLGKKEQ